MPQKLGIDLGTTFSTVSYYENGRIESVDLESADNSKTLPSIVYYPKDGDPVVGTAAAREAKLNPELVVQLIKREMGETGYTHKGTGKTAVEVSADILRTAIDEAEVNIGEKVDEVLITIPAYFGEIERNNTRLAGELAGIKEVSLLPEPHAAALAYSVEKSVDIHNKNLLVFDLGGGTFDVTLIYTENHDGNLDIKTLEKSGNKRLGGADWDELLYNLVSGKLHDEFGPSEVTGEKEKAMEKAFLMERCEEAKRDLSKLKSKKITGENPSHQVEVTRKEFEKITQDLTYACLMCLEQVLYDAENKHGIEKKDITVLLCGGSTRMPMITDMIEKVMEKPSLSYKNPDLLVSMGAAYWTQLSQGKSVQTKDPSGGLTEITVKEGALIDQAAFAIGVGLQRRDSDEVFNAEIIPAGTDYDDHKFHLSLETKEDNETAISFEIFQGDSEDIDDCDRLGAFFITDLPPDRPAGQPIDVYLGYDQDGVITGYAEDVNTNNKVKIKIDRTALA